MATIAEIIAAREAAKVASNTSPAPKQPGKPTSVGLVLTKALPPEPKTAESPMLPLVDRRSLSEPEGEAIPMTPMDAPPSIQSWHQAMNAFQTDLCLVRDPLNPEYAWLAVRFEDQPSNPILLHKLILWEHPRTVRPENEPF